MKKGKGFSYKDLANQTIIIPPNSDQQLRRLFVILGVSENR